ncbi:two-component system, cell cycle sensor histidine kinase DivJ [Rhizobium sp. RU20A]|uniref:sensor histidine kinase n=1 Tax=Rhizobium sp. RU20A TaxID=1907412 RepID=UPI00095744E3|nr:HAMP domain-containing sensor histidine kinase [Rhizobium sp. RU20A]SIR16461.1 two-component system, cell cycle sensor histidine kinase DivJ [Rhizobium sp. RU20A]
MDEIAGPWLDRAARDEQRRHELGVIRSVAALTLVALPVMPALLSIALPFSVALPAGAGLAFAGGLVAAVAGISYSRRCDAARAIAGDRDATLTEAAPPFPSLFNAFPGLVTLHDSQGNVRAVHGRDRATTFGWMRDPLGRGFVDQIHISDRIGFLQAIDALRTGEPHRGLELRMERAGLDNDGAQFVHLRIDMSAISTADGALDAILVQSTDISDAVRLRQDVERHVEHVESCNEAKSRFLTAVSHELRTPLNAILGFSEILSGEYFGKLQNDRQREYVDLIHRSGAHLLSLVNSMLDMSKIEAGRYELVPEPFVVAEEIAACEAMLQLSARERGLTLTSRVTRHVNEICADRRAFKQILINLVGNAIKFTEAGGVVTVDADIDGDNLRLAVSDTGIGIRKDMLERLGQPFLQAHDGLSRNFEGTGLGLALVKGFVALHGGRFLVESELGQGTVITILLPLDGQGIAEVAAGKSVDNGGNVRTTVEFPPRLSEKLVSETMPAGRTEPASADETHARERGHGAAQAKTA